MVRRTRRRSRTRRRRRRGGSVTGALRTALLPFLLYKGQKKDAEKYLQKGRKVPQNSPPQTSPLNIVK